MFKEGGKKGVEIEGAADMSGLTCFCTPHPKRQRGEVKLLEVAMEGMNAIPDPSDEEERKGCSGKISKIIISESEEKGQIAMVAYVAEETKDKLNAKDWLQGVCDSDLGGGVGGTVDEGATDTWATVTCKEDKEKFFFLKMKDNCLGAAIAYLREREICSKTIRPPRRRAITRRRTLSGKEFNNLRERERKKERDFYARSSKIFSFVISSQQQKRIIYSRTNLLSTPLF